MTTRLDAAFNYTNLQGLSSLKRAASHDTPEARRAVAQQFESLFLGQVLSRMRSASSIDSGLFDSKQVKFYRNLYDQQLALSLSRGHGVGLADAIFRQLGGAGANSSATGVGAGANSPASALNASPGDSGFMDLDPYQGRNAIAVRPGTQPAAPAIKGGQGANSIRSRTEQLATARSEPASPADFVTSVWPDAQRAAKALGVDPKALVAQAALETGWGKHVLSDGAGGTSFNVFALKVGSDWSGPRANVSTLEFVNGVPERRVEAFRVYGSLQEAFQDYVALIRGLPRYKAAVGEADGKAYAQALEAGGYSTDPHYAEKITEILDKGLPGTDATDQAAAKNFLPPALAIQVAGSAADNGVTRLQSATGISSRGDET